MIVPAMNVTDAKTPAAVSPIPVFFQTFRYTCDSFFSAACFIAISIPVDVAINTPPATAPTPVATRKHPAAIDKPAIARLKNAPLLAALSASFSAFRASLIS